MNRNTYPKSAQKYSVEINTSHIMKFAIQLKFGVVCQGIYPINMKPTSIQRISSAISHIWQIQTIGLISHISWREFHNIQREATIG